MEPIVVLQQAEHRLFDFFRAARTQLYPLAECGSHQLLGPSSLFGGMPDRISFQMLHRADPGLSAFAALDETLQRLQVVEYAAVRYPAAAYHDRVLELHPQRKIQLRPAE